ncbi:AB-hydrolase lipase domain [Trinorchestia longiramus]|nr:AB-hydrolase lipase domain [Trinorchestia longiramus]
MRDDIPITRSSSGNVAFKDNDILFEILPELRDILDSTPLQPTLMAVLFECFVLNVYGWNLDQLCPIEINSEDFERTLTNVRYELSGYNRTSSQLSSKERRLRNESRLDANRKFGNEQTKSLPMKNDGKWYDDLKRKYERTNKDYQTNLNSTEIEPTDVLPESDTLIIRNNYQQDEKTLNSKGLEQGEEFELEELLNQEKVDERRANNEGKGHQDHEKTLQTTQQNHSLSDQKHKRQIKSHLERQYLNNRRSHVLLPLSPRHHHSTKRDTNSLPVYQHSKTTSAQGGLPTQPPDDLYLQVPDLIRHYGYPAEVHDIRTTDDYVLTLHRIVGPQQDGSGHPTPTSTDEQKSVLLVHGFGSSSADFVIGGPDSALGFMLADAGYDVWLGNFRGNSYSKRHTSLKRDQTKYWQFSLDDLARRDVPAMVDHIIKTTHRPKIFYIGHSIGATVLPMTCFIKSDFAQKILHFSAMAPIGFGKMSRGPVKVMTNLARITYKHKEEGGGAKAQVLSRDRATVAVMFFFCSAHSIFWKLCLTLLTAAGGRNRGLFNKEMLSLVLANFPAGTSVRLAAHVGQLLSSDGLQMFDFGEDRNQELYKQATPLEYDLSDTLCPTAVYWAFNDYLAPPEDVERMVSSLPNVTEKMLVGHETFNHFDFVYSNQARHLIHTDLIKTMGKYA